MCVCIYVQTSLLHVIAKHKLCVAVNENDNFVLQADESLMSSVDASCLVYKDKESGNSYIELPYITQADTPVSSLLAALKLTCFLPRLDRHVKFVYLVSEPSLHCDDWKKTHLSRDMDIMDFMTRRQGWTSLYDNVTFIITHAENVQSPQEISRTLSAFGRSSDETDWYIDLLARAVSKGTSASFSKCALPQSEGDVYVPSIRRSLFETLCCRKGSSEDIAHRQYDAIKHAIHDCPFSDPHSHNADNFDPDRASVPLWELELRRPVFAMFHVVLAKAVHTLRSLISESISRLINHEDGVFEAIVHRHDGVIAWSSKLSYLLKQEEQRKSLRDFVTQLNMSQLLPHLVWTPDLDRLQQEMDEVAQLLSLDWKIPISVFWAKRIELDVLIQPLQREAQSALVVQKDLSVHWDNDSGQLTLSGIDISLSMCKTEVLQYPKLQHLRIFALRRVQLDCDLYLPGINLTILAREFDIDGYYTIVLSGRAGSDQRHPHPQCQRTCDCGKTGVNGITGAAGFSAGHFFCLCGQKDTDKLRRFLKVYALGGTGGQGQSGGQGCRGKDGEDAKLTRSDCGKKLVFIDAVPPRRGGNAGHAGHGGAGGLAGTCCCISVFDGTDVLDPSKVFVNAGIPGSPGSAGKPGAGGRGVREVEQGIFRHGSRYTQVSSRRSDDAPRGAEAKTCVGEVLPAKPVVRQNLLMQVHDYWLLFGTTRMFRPELTVFFNQMTSCPRVQKEIIQSNDCVDVLVRLEQSWKTHSSRFVVLPAYEALLMQMHIYSQQIKVDNSFSPNDLYLIQYVCAGAFSRVIQLRFDQDQTLVIDLPECLKMLKEQCLSLVTLDHQRLHTTYKTNYHHFLTMLIQSADSTLSNLSTDMKKTGDRINAQINVLVAEIGVSMKTTRKQLQDFKQQREQYKELVRQKSVLSFLTLGVSTAGMMAGPAGNLVASIINTGLAMTLPPKDTATTIQSLGPLIQNLAATSANILHSKDNTPNNDMQFQTLLCSLAAGAVPLANAAAAAVMNQDEGDMKIDKFDTEIAKTEQILADLIQKQKEAAGSFSDLTMKLASDACQLQGESKNLSLLQLPMHRLHVRSYFREVRLQISTFSATLRSGSTLLDLFGRIQDALDTSNDIYEQMERYREQQAFAQHMAQLTDSCTGENLWPLGCSDQFKEQVRKLQRVVHENIIMSVYTRALAAVKMHMFPIDKTWINEDMLLPSFLAAKTSSSSSSSNSAWVQTYVHSIVEQIKLLESRARTTTNEIHLFDNAVMLSSFRPPKTKAFFCWSTLNPGLHADRCSQIRSKTIRNLILKEQVVVLYADALLTPTSLTSIKFSKIELQIQSNNAEISVQLQKKLLALQYSFSLRHSGRNYYNLRGTLHQLGGDGSFQLEICRSFQLHEDGKPVEQSRSSARMSRDDTASILSPYTFWTIQLKRIENAEPLADEVEQQLHADVTHLVNTALSPSGGGLQLLLVGDGTYVNLDKMGKDF